MVVKQIESPKPLIVKEEIIEQKKEFLPADTIVELEKPYEESRKHFDNFYIAQQVKNENGYIKLSVIPSISTSFGYRSENKFSFNLFLGETYQLNGLEISGFASQLHEKSSGAQVAGFINSNAKFNVSFWRFRHYFIEKKKKIIV